MEKTMKSERLLSLDVMRGMTIAAMILVNNPAVWGKAYAPLQHAFWYGMTPTDLIYPFFVFIMGVSAFFSLSKRYEGAGREAFSRILRRSAVIFGVGLLLQEISYFGYGTANFLSGQTPADATWCETVFPFRTFRIMGVLQGLALVYLFGSAALLCLRFRHLIVAAGGLLILYLVLLQTGNGYSLSADNIIAVVDRAVLGESHLYREWLPDGSRLAFEPEGLLSTLPRIAQFLLGCAAGRILLAKEDAPMRFGRLFAFGTALLFTGLLLQYGDPLNKKIWSSSFALATSGFASLLLGLLCWVIDLHKQVRWTGFFRVFGVNPLFLYVAAWVLSVTLGALSIKSWFYTTLIDPLFGDASGSLVYSLCFILLVWSLGLVLYRRKIYIKI